MTFKSDFCDHIFKAGTKLVAIVAVKQCVTNVSLVFGTSAV